MSTSVESLRKEMNEHQGRLHRGADQSVVRAINEKLILNNIRLEGPVPRVEIADRLGLSRATVSNIVNALLRKGLVEEGSRLSATSRGGKRATAVQFKADAGYIIGVDMGRQHLTVLLTDLEGKLPDDDQSWSWSDEFDTSLGAEACLASLVERLQELLDAHKLTWDRIVGIGIGIPGTLDRDLQRLIKPPLMPGWDGVDIPRHLRGLLKQRGQTKKIPMYLDNDANMGALGESRYGAGRDYMDMIYIKIGTGIGAGLILDGHLYRGSRNIAGEFGHLIIKGDGPVCPGCKQEGCLEALAAVPAIIEDARRGRSLKETGGAVTEPPALARYPEEERNIRKVVQLAEEGDPASIAAIEEAGRCIGLAIANLINLLNPELIVLDAFEKGIARAAGERFLGPLERYAEAYSLPAAKGTIILVSELGNNGIARGAVATVLDAAFDPPSKVA